MNYLVIPKQKNKPISEFNETCDDISVDDTVEYLTLKLTGKADIIETYKYESLLDSNTIKLINTVYLSN